MGRRSFSHKSDLRSTDIPSILVGELYARGLPRDDEVHRAWDFGGGVILELFLAPEEACVAYRLTSGVPKADVEELEGRVQVSWTYPHLGGRRAWLHCNRRRCGKRTNRLYLDAPLLVCRSCAGIRYESKNRSKHARARARADKIRLKLGGEPGPYQPIPLKPRGMQWKTYDRLRLDLMEAETVWEHCVSKVIAEHQRRPLAAAITSADVPYAQPSLRALLAHRIRQELDDLDSSTAQD